MATLKEIKEELVSLGITPPAEYSKQKLEDLLATEKEAVNQMTNSFKKMPPNEAIRDIQTDIIPSPKDKEWTQYVLNQLSDTEKFKNKYPKVDGLRRFAEEYFGIFTSKTKIVQSPSPNNGNIAVVHHRIIITAYHSADGVGDASPSNTDFPYSKYLTATAETRAEGRALRRLLKLETVTAEELQATDAVFDNLSDIQDEKITDTQINFIDVMCRNNDRGNDIDVIKLIQYIYGKEYASVKQLTHSQAAHLNELLSNFQKDPQSVPNEIKGYNQTWLTNN